MVITRLTGGLGNQLFQYALGRALANSQRTILKLDVSAFETYKLHAYSLHHFNLRAAIASPSDCARFYSSSMTKRLRRLAARLVGNPYHTVKERTLFKYDPSQFPRTHNLYLHGYWQTEKYFNDITSILRSELTFKTMADPVNADFAVQIQQKTNAVCIHVRRADYVSDAQANAFHGTCSLDYYRRAMTKLADSVVNPHFFVFSDDPVWTRANLYLDKPATFVSHNKADHNYEDLRLMSLCKHFIIANSYFSWWGAWLNPNDNKIVVAPKKWIQTPESHPNDILPPSWIKL